MDRAGEMAERPMKRDISTGIRGWLALTVAVTVAPLALAGTLRIVPQVNASQVVVPVMLEGDTSTGVAALDFYLDYDPAVLEPAGISAGTAAVSAGKQVLSNMTTPGRYKVILFGVNQNVVNGGEVARVTLRRKNEPTGGRTNLKVTGTHLASVEGFEMPSSGSSETLVLGDESSEEPDEGTEPEDETGNEPETAADEGEDAAEAADTLATDPDNPAGLTPTRTSLDGTPPSSSLNAGARQPLVAGIPQVKPSGTDGGVAALARLAQMRDETRNLRNGIPSPGTAVAGAPDTVPPAPDSPAAVPDEAPPAEVGQATGPQAMNTPGMPPGAPTAATPVNPAPVDAPVPPMAQGQATGRELQAAATRTRVLIGTALAVMGGVALGLLVLRRRLFS
jgi:Cohesin domain